MIKRKKENAEFRKLRIDKVKDDVNLGYLFEDGNLSKKKLRRKRKLRSKRSLRKRKLRSKRSCRKRKSSRKK
jgi:hypothetical protein